MTIYTGDIYLFAGNFAPQGFAECNGQILEIKNYNALFSLLGTIYGGNGTTTFALPDLRDRVPIHAGKGNGLTSRTIGVAGGADTVVLKPKEIAPHVHKLSGRNTAPETNSSGVLCAAGIYHADDGGPYSALEVETVENTPAYKTDPHENRQPYLALNFWICTEGAYPQRN